MEDYELIGVQFENRYKVYHYKALIEDKINEGDQVLVMTPYSGLALVTVCEVLEAGSLPYECKWIAQKIDVSKYKTLAEAESK